MFRWVMLGTLFILQFYLGTRIYFMLRPYLQQLWPLFVLLMVLLFGAVYFYFTRRALELSGLAALYRKVGSLWLGASLVLFNFMVLYEVIRLLQRLFGMPYRPLLGLGIMALALLAIVYAFLQAHDIQVKYHDIALDKPAALQELRTVLISDLHLNRMYDPKEIEKLIDRLNAEDADLMVIAGDIFDHGLEAGMDLEHLKHELLRLKSTYGIYAALGNHDMYAGDHPEVIAFLEGAGVRVLQDEMTEVQGIQLIGRADYHVQSTLPPISVDHSRPLFVIDHQPKRHAEALALGTDVIFSGHTHGGQIFPGNLMVHWVHDHGYGYRKVGDMHSFVSSGLRYWVTPLRFGSDSEIVVIDIHFP